MLPILVPVSMTLDSTAPQSPLKVSFTQILGVQLPGRTALSQCKWKPSSNMRKHILVKDDVRLLIWRLSDLSITREPKQQSRKNPKQNKKHPKNWQRTKELQV